MRIWSHLLKKSLINPFVQCSTAATQLKYYCANCKLLTLIHLLVYIQDAGSKTITCYMYCLVLRSVGFTIRSLD